MISVFYIVLTLKARQDLQINWLYDWSYHDIGHMNGHVAEYSLNE